MIVIAILAIDQGQTKTIVLLLDTAGKILGIGKGPGASAYYDGPEKAVAMVKKATEPALTEAGLSFSDIDMLCAGMTGANWPDEFRALEDEFKKQFGIDGVIVYNDAVIALRAGDGGKNAFILCSGSGMNCVASKDGEIRLVYNNYVDLYDQGSEGFTSRALKATFDAFLGYEQKSPLKDRLMDYFEIHDMTELMLKFYRGQLEKPLKGAAELVFQEAAENDPVALEVIYGFGKSIARYVIGAVKKFDIDPADFTVILSGGVFKNPNPLLVETVCSQIHRKYATIKIKQAYFEPVVGAGLFMLDRYGERDDCAHETLKSTAEARGLVRY